MRSESFKDNLCLALMYGWCHTSRDSVYSTWIQECLNVWYKAPKTPPENLFWECISLTHRERFIKNKLITCAKCTNQSVSANRREKISPLFYLTLLWFQEITHQFANLFLTVRCWSGSCSNHSGSLIVSEFLYASLSCHYVAHLKQPHTKEGKKKKNTPNKTQCNWHLGWVLELFSLVAALHNFWRLVLKKNCLPTLECLLPSPLPRSQNPVLPQSLLASRGRYVCFCSCPTCKHGRWG